MSFQFVILQRLNSGGNADLFIAQRSDTREYVVVKYLREYHDAHARKAFAREVRLLERRLGGLMPLVFADTAGERPYYVMPYLKAGALTQYAGRLTDSQLHTVATELALTLAGLHAALEAHGDFKPDNVLVTQDGRLQVADPLGNGTLFTILFSQNHGGTPGYWAPEISMGGPISRPGDVFSYGATLYHLQTGCRPQDGQRADPALVGYVNAPKIREIIAACCQVDSNERPTMPDVLRMLRGERWADIQAPRKQIQQLVGVALVIGIFVLVGRFLAKIKA